MRAASPLSYLLATWLSAAVLATGCAGGPGPARLSAEARSTEAARLGGPPAPRAGVAPALPSASAPPGPAAVVKLAYLPIRAHAPFFVAWDKGYWREEGLEVEGTEFGGSDQVMPFLAVGQLDVAGGSSGAGFLNMLAQGIGGRIVAGLSSVGPDGLTGQALMVRREDFEGRRFTSPADLRGRRVAVNGKGVYSEFLADRHLRQGGLTLNDVDLVILGLPEMLAGLVDGAVEAADLTEPTVTQAQDRGIAVPIARANGDPNGQTQVLLYGEQFVQNNAEGARRFMLGYLRALRELARSEYRDPTDLPITARYTKLPADVVQRVVPPYADPNGHINVAHLELQQRFFAERGYLTYAEPLALDRFVDTSWLDLAIQQLGP